MSKTGPAARRSKSMVGAPGKTLESDEEQLEEWTRILVDLINLERTTRELLPLKKSDKLCHVARTIAKEHASQCGNVGKDGCLPDLEKILSGHNVFCDEACELIACGFEGPLRFHACNTNDAWLQQITRADMTDVGFSVHKSKNGTMHWVEVFAANIRASSERGRVSSGLREKAF